MALSTLRAHHTHSMSLIRSAQEGAQWPSLKILIILVKSKNITSGNVIVISQDEYVITRVRGEAEDEC